MPLCPLDGFSGFRAHELSLSQVPVFVLLQIREISKTRVYAGRFGFALMSSIGVDPSSLFDGDAKDHGVGNRGSGIVG